MRCVVAIAPLLLMTSALNVGGAVPAAIAQAQARFPAEIEISRVEAEGQSQIRLTSRTSGRWFALPVAVTEVLSVVPSRASGAYVVVGRANHANSVDVIDFQNGRAIASVFGVDPVVSTDGSFVAYRKSYPRGAPEQPAVYHILATQTGNQAGPGGFAYPPADDKLLHSSQSVLGWIGNNVLVFLDFVDGKTGLVALELGASGRLVRQARQDLPTDTIIDASKLEGNAHPARAISAVQFRQLEGEGLHVRVIFPDSPGLKAKRVDLQMW